LKCESGYILDEENDECIINCYELCKTCYDYSNDPENQNCKECNDGYSLSNKNCVVIHEKEKEKEIEKEKEKEKEK
jgi:hypothetical protein